MQMFPLYRPDHNTQRKEAETNSRGEQGSGWQKKLWDSPKQDLPASLSVEENLTSAMAVLKLFPFCFAEAKKEIKYIKIFILPKLLFLGSQLQD